MKWCLAVMMTLAACSPLTPFQDGGAGGSPGGGVAGGASGGLGGGLAGGGGGGLVGGGLAGGTAEPDAGCDCVAPANGVPHCAPGGCDFTCQQGFHRCGPRCVADDSVLECGPGCVACPANGGTPSCVQGGCDFECGPTQAKCNGQCVPESDVACGRDCRPCEVGARCRAGVCAVSCAPGRALVAGSCRSNGRDVAVGILHACGRHDGGVACWGTGVSTGVLGSGFDAGRGPVSVSGLGEVLGVWAGDNFSCAITEPGGQVWCWGSNMFGQVGNGGTANAYTPQLAVASGATGMTAGGRHACAVLRDAGVVGWGTNLLNQLGSGGQATGVRAPVPMVLDAGAESVWAEDEATWVLAPGLIRLAGIQSFTGAFSTTPVTVQFDAGMRQVAGGLSHGCAVTSSRSLWCWGRGLEGQLGYPVPNSARQPPRPVPGMENVADLCTGAFSTCVVIADGGVRCFGEGDYGQLGGGNFTSSSTPVEALGLPPATQVACWARTACASTEEGVWCWGDNSYGQLGVANPSSSNRPIRVPLP